MSIDLNWETVTGGPDGQALADKIRDFIHTKFQSVPLPRFIKSVTVHDFQFGSIPPELELKDITDPLPDFYEDHVDSDLASDSDGDDESGDGVPQEPNRRSQSPESGMVAGGHRHAGYLPPHLVHGGGVSGVGVGSSRNGDIGNPFLRVSTPGIPGGTSNLHYFHPRFAGGLSGTQTPLAAVASAQHFSAANWPEGHGYSSSVPNLHHQDTAGGAGSSPRGFADARHSRNPSQSSICLPDGSPTANLAPQAAASLDVPSLREKHSVSTLAPTSTSASRPPTRDAAATLMGSSAANDNTSGTSPPANTTATSSTNTTSNNNNNNNDNNSGSTPSTQPPQQPQDQEPQRRFREPRLDDTQAVFRIRYAGDVKLLLTADILLDYPMPSFVGIPVRLSITGLTFDGVGVLAKIRRRVHFCFLSPEDAVAAVGDDGAAASDPEQRGHRQAGQASGTTKLGGLLQEIRVESEIGQRESGRQSLKNVGKVERFVLEQVRRIFEEEFVYPSFWTFLV